MLARPTLLPNAGQEFVVDGGVSKKMVYPEEEVPRHAGEGQQAAHTHGAAATAAPAAAAAAGERGESSGDEQPSVMWPDE